MEQVHNATLLSTARVAIRRSIVRFAACAPISVVAVAPWLTGCQNNGSRRTRIRSLAVTDTRGHLEFVARQREEERKPKTGGGEERGEETIFEERLQLEAEGFVYHPNLLEFSLAALFGLQQFDFEETFGERKQRDSQNATIVEFDLNGTVFKNKSFPLTVFARRSRSLQPRPFRSSIDTTNTSYGVSWRYVSAKTPAQLTFTRSVLDQDPFLQAGEQKGRRESTVLRFEGEHRFSDHNLLSLNFDHENIAEQPLDVDYSTDELTLAHYLDFGEGFRQRLDSELNYFAQGGTFDSDRLRWRETLRLTHSDTLQTWHQFEASDRSQGRVSGNVTVKERSYRGTSTLEHRLYESLVSQLSVYFQHQDFESGLNVRQYGAGGSLAYRKKNPWGVLHASYRVRFVYEKQRGGEVDMEVVESPSTFADPEPMVLDDPNIELSSILIIRQDRMEVYSVGSDYRLRRIGDQVEVERIVTGRIQDGETVLISYQFRIGGTFDIDTVDQQFGVRQEFAFGLSSYCRLRRQDQSLRPRNASGITPEDITAFKAGIEYRRPLLRLAAEYEDYDSTISPFLALRFSAEYARDLADNATASVSASWSDIRFRPPVGRDTRLFSLEGRYRHRITPRLNFEGRVAFRDQDDTLFTDNEGLEADVSLEWLIRQTEIRLTYGFKTFEDDFAEQDSSTLLVQVRRRF